MMTLIDHEYRMCLKGQPPYIQPYKVVTTEEGHRVTFDKKMTPWMTPGERMTFQSLVHLFTAITGVVATCHYWLLDFGRIDLAFQAIKSDEHDRLFFEYHPFEEATDENHHERLARLLQVVHTMADDSDEASMALLHRIGIALSEEPFDLKRFAQQVERTLEASL